jgi:hypothetical protein
MNWGPIFLAGMSVGYLAAAIAYWFDGNDGYSVALFCYSIANCGLIYAGK